MAVRCLLAFWAIACMIAFFAAGCGQKVEDTPLAGLKVDFEALAQVGTLTYNVGLGADPKGNQPSRTFLLELGVSLLPDAVALHDTLIVGESRTTAVTISQKNSFLDLKKSMLTAQVGESVPKTETVTVADGKALVQNAQGMSLSLDYPPGTVSQSALFRLVTQLPREKGRRFVFYSYFDPLGTQVETARPNSSFALEYRGVQNAVVGGQAKELGLFELTGVRRPMQFFVDEKGILQQMSTDDGATVMWLVP
ncbi:MAG: hypothetical protein QMD09_11800 [Desulfatibacillaceae bacterium]|nr:hypothetical protein [Desulfatibacillaceae bacterium]